jgi:hypothetical protein
MSIIRDLKQALRGFSSPDSAEVNFGALKLKYTETLQSDAAAVAALFLAKRVLFAGMEHELWMCVFPSLEELRNTLSNLSGKLHAKGPGDVRSAVDWMVTAISAYLGIYQADYTQFMQGPTYPDLDSAPAHKERNWPLLGPAARDLIELRGYIGRAIQNVNAFADSGSVIEWKEPHPYESAAVFWVRYAEDRQFCPRCGFNLYYGDEGECPRCPPVTPTLLLTPIPGEPGMQQVFVAGTFNDWTPVPMDFSYARWCWRKRLDLSSGTYYYKFIRDGVWFVDPSNPRVQRDENGNSNSILVVV